MRPGNDTEQRILDAALDVLADKTISGTRVQLIADRAGIAKSHFHYYFKTKNEVLVALLEILLQSFLDDRVRILAENKDSCLRDKLNIFFRQKKRYLREDSRVDFIEMDFWVHSKVDDTSRDFLARSYSSWRNHIREVLEEYLPDLPEDKKQVIPYQIVSLMIGASIQYLIDESFDLDLYFEVALDTLMKTLEEYLPEAPPPPAP